MHGSGERWRVTLGAGVAVAAADGHDATPRSRKARGLIAFLAAASGQTATRAELVALLWSDRGREQARASLRQCLFELRQEAPGLVDAVGEAVALGGVTVAVTPCRGGLPLADLDALDPAFDRWLAARRVAWPATAAPDTAPDAAAVPARRWRWPALAAGVAAAVAGGWFALRPPALHAPTLVLTSLAAGDVASRAAAARFAEAARTMLAPTRVRLLPGTGTARADWIAGGAVGGGGVEVHVATPQGALLWSARAASGAEGVAAAADRLGHRAARVLACAAGGPPMRRDVATTARLMAFCDVMLAGGFVASNEAAVAILRRLVAAAPQDAYAHGNLATTLAINAGFVPPALAASAQAEAEREAARALALDPRTGEAWLARGVLADERRDFAGVEVALRRGLAAEPDNPSLPNYLASALTATGRLDEALVEAQRALAFDPGSPAKHADVAALLLRTGNPRAAFALLDDPGIDDPGRIIPRRRVILLLWTGDMAAVRAAIAAAGDAFEPAAAARLIARTRAVEDPHGPAAAALLAQVAAIRDDPDQAAYRVGVLASLGRADAALDEALRAPVDTELFFRPNTRALLLSPRFPAVARFQGLWAHWTTTGHWPDICADPALGWHCGSGSVRSSAAR